MAGSLSDPAALDLASRRLAGFGDRFEAVHAVYDDIARAFHAESDGERAAAIELAVEALYLTQKISKDSGEGETIYG